MTNMDILGFVATGLTTGSLVPQVIKIYKTKDVSSISLSMYIMYFSGILLWIGYGFHLNLLPIHISNFFGFIMSLFIIVMKIKYNQKVDNTKIKENYDKNFKKEDDTTQVG